MRFAAPFLFLVLSGCTAVSGYIDSAIEARKRMNDEQARLTIIALCDISIGSRARVLDDQQKALVDAFCERGAGGR